MAESQTQGVPFLKLNGGLNAAGSPINMEPTDAADLLNVDLNLSGSFSWRKPIDFLGEQAAGDFFLLGQTSHTSNGIFKEGAPCFTFFGVTKSDTSFVTYAVVVIDRKLYVYDFTLLNNLIEVNNPYQVIDLTSYSDSTMPFRRTQFSMDRNKLFIINEGCQPGYLYLASDTAFDFAPVTITTRNITKDGATADSYVSKDGKQYLCIKAHTSSAADAPGTGANWRIYWIQFGPAPSGSTAWVTSTAYVTNVETLSYKFSGLCFSSSRLWLTGYAGEPNKIYFSQTITDDLRIGRMYQFADPLNKDDSAAADTDGGDMVINGAEKVLNITEFQNGVLVFATNGVWYIGGSSSTDTFTPTSFSLNKVSDSGCIGANCFCRVDDYILYMGQGSIFAITKEDLFGKVKAKPISDKVEPFYTSIPIANRARTLIRYNQSERKVYFWTNFKSYAWTRDWNPDNIPTHFRDALILDVQVKGWSLYSLEDDEDGERLSISDFVPSSAIVANADSVVDNGSDTIISESGDFIESLTGTESDLINLCMLYKKCDTKVCIAFGRTGSLGSTDFSLHERDDVISDALDDLITEDGELVGTDDDVSAYDAYFVTAPQTFGNMGQWKQNPYLILVFTRQESGVIDDTTGEDITQGGCLMTVMHDWAGSTSSSRFQNPRQVYRPNRYTTSRFDGVATGDTNIVVKEKILGRGHAVQLKFSKDEGKPCELHGMQFGVSSSQRTI